MFFSARVAVGRRQRGGMAGYGALLVAALSQDAGELPPTRVYALMDGVETPLALIAATASATPQSPAVAAVVGAIDGTAHGGAVEADCPRASRFPDARRGS